MLRTAQRSRSLSFLSVFIAAATTALIGLAPGALAFGDEEEKDPGPTEEEVEAAVGRIEKALEEGSFEEKVKVLVDVRDVEHEEVAKAVAKAVKDDAKEVRLAALGTLGYLHVDYALKQLTGYTKKRAMTEDEATAIELYKAIGRHGDKKSLKVLEDKIFNCSEKVIEARILAIGKIRHDDAVDLVVSIMNKMRVNEGGKGEPKGERENVPHMQQIRLALHVLTGADEGTKRSDWQRWWNDNKHDIEVTEIYPSLDRTLQAQWNSFWGESAREKKGGGPGGREDKPAPAPEGEPGDEPGEDPSEVPAAA